MEKGIQPRGLRGGEALAYVYPPLLLLLGNLGTEGMVFGVWGYIVQTHTCPSQATLVAAFPFCLCQQALGMLRLSFTSLACHCVVIASSSTCMNSTA